MKRKDNAHNYKLDERDWKVVEERLKTMSNNVKLGILSKSYSKQELILEVKNRTEVGEAYVEMQKEFIRWLAKQSIHQAMQ